MDKVKKLWGHEVVYVNNEMYCFKKLVLKKGYQSSLHFHKEKDETFVIVHGKILLEHDGKKSVHTKNETIRIKPNERHRFRSITPKSAFYEVSTHDKPEDSIRIEPSKVYKCLNKN